MMFEAPHFYSLVESPIFQILPCHGMPKLRDPRDGQTPAVSSVSRVLALYVVYG